MNKVAYLFPYGSIPENLEIDIINKNLNIVSTHYVLADESKSTRVLSDFFTSQMKPVEKYLLTKGSEINELVFSVDDGVEFDCVCSNNKLRIIFKQPNLFNN